MDFYITADGRVFLLLTPDEPACLHQCHGLPSTPRRVAKRWTEQYVVANRLRDKAAPADRNISISTIRCLQLN